MTELKTAAIDLLNQLALLTRDDPTYLWRIGGRGLDDAYKALKAAVDDAAPTALESQLGSAHEEIARLEAGLRHAARMFTIKGARRVIEDTLGSEAKK